jgi:hypothetical protein
MNIETAYSILIDSGWFFLASWTLLLLVASAVVFWDESLQPELRLARSRSSVIYLPTRTTIPKAQKVQSMASRH